MKRNTWRGVVLALVCGPMLGGLTARAEEGRGGEQCECSLDKQLTKSVQCRYLLYLPKGYEDSQEEWPLVLFLHGAGERGDDLTRVSQWGPPRLVKEGKDFPFILVSPQCPGDGWWSLPGQVNALDALLDDISARYRVDEDRVYLTGLSMGGFGTWQMAFEFPNRFAAIAPVCGKGEPFLADTIKHVPAWVFHGEKDSVVPFQASQDMVNALEKCGGDVKFTPYPNTDHNSWTATYENPALYEWLLSHTRPAGAKAK